MSFSRQTLVLAIAALVASCSSSTAPHNTGALTITVSASGSATPQVIVIGPSAFRKTITSTTTLTGLASGSYTITAPNVLTNDAVVPALYQGSVTGSPATVTAVDTASASVSYVSRPGTGSVWVVGGYAVGGKVQNMAFSYTGSELHTSGTATAAVALTFPSTPGLNFNANDVAFDFHGNMWVVNDNTNTVVEYTPAQLTSSGTPTPATTIQFPAGSYTEQLAFDAASDLWVMNDVSGTIEEFTAAALQAGGSPTPAVTITMGNIQGQIADPLSMAFDGQGNLWVVTGAELLLEYTASQLTTSGTPTPALVRSPQVVFPYYIAFDPGGNLWISTAPTNSNGTVIPGSITEFTMASVTGSATPSPALTLRLPIGTEASGFPTAIAFDEAGNLWYTDFENNIIGQYDATQFAAGGNPSPVVTIVNSAKITGTAFAFNPHSPAVPLH